MKPKTNVGNVALVIRSIYENSNFTISHLDGQNVGGGNYLVEYITLHQLMPQNSQKLEREQYGRVSGSILFVDDFCSEDRYLIPTDSIWNAHIKQLWADGFGSRALELRRLK